MKATRLLLSATALAVEFGIHNSLVGHIKFGKRLPRCERAPKPKPVVNWRERLWRHISPEPMSGCWLWTASETQFGYGQINYKRRPERAYRLAWLLYRGEIPRGALVCHKCDNPPCCNPDHLFLGTHQDNCDDRERKGRSRPPLGERHAHARLTAADVLRIRALAGTRTLESLAEEYGVWNSTIYRAQSGKIWKHLPGATRTP